jgi:hypothetical protein
VFLSKAASNLASLYEETSVSSLEWAFLRVDFHISRPCLGSLGPFHLAKIKMGGSWNLPGYLDQYPFCQKKFLKITENFFLNF